MNRMICSATLLAFLMAALPSMVKADTYLSFWKNETACAYTIVNNSLHPVTLHANSKHDFGPFPKKDPIDLQLRPASPSCAKETRFDFAGSFAGKTCGGRDPGPYKFTVNAGGNATDFCYCVTWGRVAYLNVHVKDQNAILEHGPNTYACGNP
jgi:hypothetical protein